MFAEIFSDYARSTKRQWPTRRLDTMGASEAGQCARCVWYIKHETEHDPDYTDSWGAQARGSVFENSFWEPALRLRYGAALKGAGAQQRTLVSGYLSATLDGLVVGQPRNALKQLGVGDIGEGQCFLVECKTRDPRAPVDAPKPEHAFQLQVQLGLVRERSPYRPEYAVITYTDASWWDDVKEFPIRFDPVVFANAKARAARIMTANTAEALAPEGFIAGGRECGWCPFAKRCGVERRRVPPEDTAEIDTEFAASVVARVREVKYLEAEGEVIATRVREGKHEIKERLRERGLRKVSANGESVAWVSVAGKHSYDNKALRDAAIAAGVDVEQFVTIGEPSDRLVPQIRAYGPKNPGS
jgi:hypothetical protein